MTHNCIIFSPCFANEMENEKCVFLRWNINAFISISVKKSAILTFLQKGVIIKQRFAVSFRALCCGY